MVGLDYRKLVTTNMNEARIIHSRLAADGVIAEIRGPSSTYPMGAASVYVLMDDYERATDLLNVSHDGIDEQPSELARRRSGIMRGVGLLVAVALALPFVVMFVSLLGRMFD